MSIYCLLRALPGMRLPGAWAEAQGTSFAPKTSLAVAVGSGQVGIFFIRHLSSFSQISRLVSPPLGLIDIWEKNKSGR